MERHDIQAELATIGAQELLASTAITHLAYVGKDATPRVIPIGSFWTGTAFVLCTAVTAPKVTALSARPDVALTMDGGDTPDLDRPAPDLEDVFLNLIGRSMREDDH